MTWPHAICHAPTDSSASLTSVPLRLECSSRSGAVASPIPFRPIPLPTPSRPAQVPGLAHLLEHAVHLGTARYPDPKDYKAFLSQHGGSSNASTSK